MVTPTLCCQTFKLTHLPAFIPLGFTFPPVIKGDTGHCIRTNSFSEGRDFISYHTPRDPTMLLLSYHESSGKMYIYILLSLVCKETTHTHTQRNHSFFWPWPLILTIHISSPSKQISWMGWLKLSFLLLHLPSAPILFLKNFHSVKAFEKASVLYQLHHHFAIKDFKRVFDA